MKSENYNEAVSAIKQAILQSQYRSVKLVTGEQLSLYFGIGCYVSVNSRKGTWGTGAISRISEQLRKELPGLRGFSEQNIRNMRTFVEYVIRDYNSPMGVATYKNAVDMDEKIRKSLPDMEEMRKLLTDN